MKATKIALLTVILLIGSLLLTACWNYKEVDEFDIVAGVAVDKEKNELYRVTAELVELSGEKDLVTTSKLIMGEGKTIFEAVRNMIAVSGHRLYWAHATVLILSKQVAAEGIAKVLDWYTRDAETRETVSLLVASGESAREIFEKPMNIKEIKSFTLADTLKNEVSLSKTAVKDVLEYAGESREKGTSTSLAAVSLKPIEGQPQPQISGVAVIKDDKLAGFISGDEARALDYIADQIKGGVLVVELHEQEEPTSISLEIFKSKTKVQPIINGKEITMNIMIESKIAIDEISGPGKFIEEERVTMLEKMAAEKLKKEIEALVQKMQTEYDADIFGFGAKLREDKFKEWNTVKDDWNNVFKNVKLSFDIKMHIKNSAIINYSYREGSSKS